MAEECIRRRPEISFLLVGDGPLRAGIEREAIRRGLDRNIRFAGARSDVPRLMLAAMDLMVLPSLWEGLGVVVLEAQAAGLPSLVSEQLPEECGVVPNAVERIDLGAGPAAWAQRILAALDARGTRSQPAPGDWRRSMSIETSAQKLQDFYIAAAGRGQP